MLHVATRYAQLESALLLLERGADPSLQDEVLDKCLLQFSFCNLRESTTLLSNTGQYR